MGFLIRLLATDLIRAGSELYYENATETSDPKREKNAAVATHGRIFQGYVTKKFAMRAVGNLTARFTCQSGKDS